MLPFAIPLQAAPAPQSPIATLGPILPMVAIFLIFYFLFIRPQQKKQRDQEALLKAIDKGDDVVTMGGLHGRVVGTTDDVLTLEIAALKGERVRVKVSRAKIDSVQKARKGEKEEES